MASTLALARRVSRRGDALENSRIEKFAYQRLLDAGVAVVYALPAPSSLCQPRSPRLRSAPALMLADCQTQRCRRAFPEHFPILNRKSPEFTKAKTGRDFADGHGRTMGRH
jgi:hypothetical protein